MSSTSSPAGTRDPPKLRPPLTAASVAKAHFEAELGLHIPRKHPQLQARTVVILHDLCYGHRYSRPRTSKANLSTIVERPERLRAAALGVAAAYVRLGGRHAGGKSSLQPQIDFKPLSDIPFHIHKSSRSISLTSPIVANVHGTRWMTELKLMCDAADAKLALNGKELVRHERSDGDDEDKPPLHEGDLYLCGQSLDALEGTIGAVCDAVDTVFQGADGSSGPTRAFVCVRPPGHHCSASYPSGFCWLNNVHVGISYAAQTYGLTHVAIIDFDLHHGDGSQAIAWSHNARLARLPKNASNLKRSSIGYFSLHDINSYPCEMGDEEKVRNGSVCVENAHGQTVWNVHLQAWKSESEFWDLYESKYSILLDKARGFLRSHTQRLHNSPNHLKPKAAIFLSAGFDASEWEGEGMQRHKVNVPTSFYARFTQDVVKLANEGEGAVEGRIISLLEGGYSDRALFSGVLSHISGLTCGTSTLDEPKGEQGLGYEMGRRMGTFSDDDQQRSEPGRGEQSYDAAWWDAHNLEALEAMVNPRPLPPPSRKARTDTPPTYTSSTQSFMAKMVSSPKPYRSASGSSTNGHASSPPALVARVPSPPPPEIDWATAAHELGKLLIPSDRPTRSCLPEELSVEASRGKKTRHSTIGLPTASEPVEAKRRVLRDRKGRMPNYVGDEEDTKSKVTMSRSDRRRTVAGPAVVGDPADLQSTRTASRRLPPVPAPASRRRSSASSSIISASDELIPRPFAPSMNGTSSTVSLALPPSENALPGAATSITLAHGTKPGWKVRAAPHSQPQPQPRAGVRKGPVQEKSRPEASVPRLSEPLIEDHANSLVGQGSSGPELGFISPPSGYGTDPKGDQAAAGDADVDQLTSGFVRIKLNVPSREAYEARRAS